MDKQKGINIKKQENSVINISAISGNTSDATSDFTGFFATLTRYRIGDILQNPGKYLNYRWRLQFNLEENLFGPC
jgi:hypothetical protein